MGKKLIFSLVCLTIIFGLTLPISSVAYGLSPGDIILGYWNFDEGSGTTAHDSSLYNNDGELHNAAGFQVFQDMVYISTVLMIPMSRYPISLS
jgi:hypothetical protein